ncbi:hypothetical protein BHE74_00043272, partial [Ensete ventricosum]
ISSYGTGEPVRPVAGGMTARPVDDQRVMGVAGMDRSGYGGGRLEPPLPPDASNTLFVEGLPSDCTRREVSHIFRPFVGFQEVRLVTKDSRHVSPFCGRTSLFDEVSTQYLYHQYFKSKCYSLGKIHLSYASLILSPLLKLLLRWKPCKVNKNAKMFNATYVQQRFWQLGWGWSSSQLGFGDSSKQVSQTLGLLGKSWFSFAGYKFDENDRESSNLRLQFARFPPRSSGGHRGRR